MSVVKLQGTLVKIKKAKHAKGCRQFKFVAPEVKIPELEPYLLGKMDNEPTRFKIKGIHSMWGTPGTWEGCPYRIRKGRTSNEVQFFFWVDDTDKAGIFKGGKMVEADEVFGYRCDIVARAKQYTWYDAEAKLLKKGWSLELLKLEADLWRSK